MSGCGRKKNQLLTVTSDFQVLFITEARGCVIVFAPLDGLITFFKSHFNHKGEQFRFK